MRSVVDVGTWHCGSVTWEGLHSKAGGVGIDGVDTERNIDCGDGVQLRDGEEEYLVVGDCRVDS